MLFRSEAPALGSVARSHLHGAPLQALIGARGLLRVPVPWLFFTERPRSGPPVGSPSDLMTTPSVRRRASSSFVRLDAAELTVKNGLQSDWPRRVTPPPERLSAWVRVAHRHLGQCVRTTADSGMIRAAGPLAELADAGDLKSSAVTGIPGSSPGGATRRESLRISSPSGPASAADFRAPGPPPGPGSPAASVDVATGRGGRRGPGGLGRVGGRP